MAYNSYDISGDALEALKELIEITGENTDVEVLCAALRVYEDIIRKQFNRKTITALSEDQIQILKDNGVILLDEDFYDNFILPDKYEMARKYFEKAK